MPEYIVQPGIVLLKIQNIWLLCADRKARKECKYVCEINETAALVWNLLASGNSINSIIDQLSSKYEITDIDQLSNDINDFVDHLIENHYLITSSVISIVDDVEN